MGQTIYGLDMFHCAEVVQDDEESLKFGTPIKIPGAVSIKVDPKSEQTKFWADNGVYDIFNSMGDIDLEAEMADLPLKLQNKIYGHTEENGVSFASAEDKAIHLAFGFRAKKSTGGYRYYWFLKGLPELMAIESKTTEDKADPESAKFKVGFMPLQNPKGKRRWKAQAEDSDTFNGEGWFNQVVYDGSAFASDSGSKATDLGK
ncbi:major tail protein [Bacillus glycinifermentans]|uniref:Phage tail protein n=4 Tax=Bacillus glycinifermentans TaxID=1664069 RepID=A0A0T6BM09_9BACI|nr:major tail protein [Bacillus glycinifermentans]ATH95176.1 phage tail protein [Bacillus glycinifermentans]KRT92681.1 phage tail protein [Bacillus glycinifermentans]MEC0487977.1 phage tail protein [Bacillus glycinifermentans]